VLNIYVRKHRC